MKIVLLIIFVLLLVVILIAKLKGRNEEQPPAEPNKLFRNLGEQDEHEDEAI